MVNTSSSAASAGISILDTATGSAAKFSGSSLFIKALSEQGNVSMALNQTDPTANLTPVAYQLSSQRGILSSSSSTATANVGVTSSMTTTLTTGLFMTVLPFIQENGDVQLQFAFSYTSPPKIESFVSQDGNTRNDLPTTSTEGLARKVNLRSGQTLVLTGSEQQNVSADKRGTFTPCNFILGGRPERLTRVYHAGHHDHPHSVEVAMFLRRRSALRPGVKIFHRRRDWIVAYAGSRCGAMFRF